MGLLDRLVGGGPAGSAPPGTAAQDWLPLQDLRDDCVIRKDGAAIGGLQLGAVNLALKSEGERRAVVQAVHAALNSLTAPWELLSVYRPVDLDPYLHSLSALSEQVDGRRRAVLRDYLSWVSRLAQGGESVERRYHLLIERRGPDAAREHRQSLPALAADLQRAPGLRATPLDAAAWRELLFLLFHHDQAAAEPVPDGMRLPPVLHDARSLASSRQGRDGDEPVAQ